MKLSFKNNRKTIKYDINKRNVKIYKVIDQYILIQFNSDEIEPVLPYAKTELVYYAEIADGLTEHKNDINAVIKE